MVTPRMIGGDELEHIREQFKRNSDTSVIGGVRLVRFNSEHILIERADETALLITISQK